MMPILAIHDDHTKAVFAILVPSEGVAHEWVINRIIKCVEALGCIEGDGADAAIGGQVDE